MTTEVKFKFPNKNKKPMGIKENKMNPIQVNLVNIMVSEYGIEEKIAKMQAGKAIKKITGESSPENGLVDLDVAIEALQATVDSKASKFKEMAKTALIKLKNDDFEDSWFLEHAPKETTAKSPADSKLKEKLEKIKKIAMEDGLDDILEIINA